MNTLKLYWLQFVHWLAVTYLGDFHGTHQITSKTWYPYVVYHVRVVQRECQHDTSQDRRNVVSRAVRARFLQKGMEPPPLRDIHLAIEHAVRDNAH